MKSPEHQKRAVREYVESQCQDEEVVHLEKVASERIHGTKHDIWDVHTDEGRWWVITNPTNLYSQADFQSMDVALSFHVGLRARMIDRQQLHLTQDERDRFRETERRWGSAVEALDEADEAEEFQAVGMRCRECLLALVREAELEELVPEGEEVPKRGDFVGWSELIANGVLAGSRAKELRRYAKAVAKSTWDLVQWLTHARNATRYDALIALEATCNVTDVFVTAIRRWETGAPDRCPDCGSYQIVQDFRRELFEEGVKDPYVTLCEACGWEVRRGGSG